ncbi:MAG: hypothetical protein MHM6MM_000857 [Cercozoa sp. M6MM]
MGCCTSTNATDDVPLESRSETESPVSARSPRTETAESKQPEATYVDTLVEIPFFSQMASKSLKQLSTLFESHTYQNGDVIRAGNDEFNVIVRGAVDVSVIVVKNEQEDEEEKRDTHETEISIGRRQAGEWFGEHTLMSQDDGTMELATVRAVACEDKTTVLSISRQRYAEFADEAGLRVTVSDKSVVVTLHELPLFRAVPESHLRVLARLCKFRRAAIGEVVIRQGDEADGLFVVVSGRLNVSAHVGQGEEVFLSSLSPSEHFGEMSLLPASSVRTRTATVRAVEPCVLLFLSRDLFLEFSRVSPVCSSENFRALLTQRTANVLKT